MKVNQVENKARLAIIVFVVALLLMIGLSVLLYLQSHGQIASSVLLYLFSYQIIALVFGVGLIFLLMRWLLRPYRRIVEAARESPVHVSSARTEAEFVVETFQALIEQLQAKEKELANLHALERRRAERSERFSERLIANIPSGMVTLDARGRITSINAHALKIFGAADTGAVSDSAENPGTGQADYKAFFKSSPTILGMLAECLETGKTFRRKEADVNLPDGRVRQLGLSIS